ncbi:hypothetical protein BH92_10690 [Rhodococcoides fascians A21d2]|uniref:hypothetical protein n=1 Tax=Rhodococcoides fascians TaxID=1828 RepID=UPI0013EF2CAE|nr:hypothetical protein [Rhodococcus fascians]QII00283.1 hypothetical protein BH92_10690 [Rhodococcus fascians A21d2]
MPSPVQAVMVGMLVVDARNHCVVAAASLIGGLLTAFVLLPTGMAREQRFRLIVAGFGAS